MGSAPAASTREQRAWKSTFLNRKSGGLKSHNSLLADEPISSRKRRSLRGWVAYGAHRRRGIYTCTLQEKQGRDASSTQGLLHHQGNHRRSMQDNGSKSIPSQRPRKNAGLVCSGFRAEGHESPTNHCTTPYGTVETVQGNANSASLRRKRQY